MGRYYRPLENREQDKYFFSTEMLVWQASYNLPVSNAARQALSVVERVGDGRLAPEMPPTRCDPATSPPCSAPARLEPLGPERLTAVRGCGTQMHRLR